MLDRLEEFRKTIVTYKTQHTLFFMSVLDFIQCVMYHNIFIENHIVVVDAVYGLFLKFNVKKESKVNI